MKTFLLGSSGIIGSAVVEQLNIMNYEFTGLDKQNPPENSQIKRFIKLDMNNLASVSDICDMVLDAENNGRINIINCAGYDAKPTNLKFDATAVDKMIMINQRWPVEFIQNLVSRNHHSEILLNVILLDTTYTKISPRPKNYHSNYMKPYSYIMSKAYTESFVKYMTVHYPQHKFNCIAPHLVVTDEDNLREKTNLLSNDVVKRSCKPEEIASLICYLLDPISDFIKGERIKVDGGWTS